MSVVDTPWECRGDQGLGGACLSSQESALLVLTGFISRPLGGRDDLATSSRDSRSRRPLATGCSGFSVESVAGRPIIVLALLKNWLSAPAASSLGASLSSSLRLELDGHLESSSPIPLRGVFFLGVPGLRASFGFISSRDARTLRPFMTGLSSAMYSLCAHTSCAKPHGISQLSKQSSDRRERDRACNSEKT